MKEKIIKIFDQEVYYMQNEVKGKYTLLFLHGWGTNKESFLPIINKLEKENVSIIAIDFPGFGASEEPKGVWGVQDYANLVDEFIKMIKLHNVIVVGHSFGGRVSFYLSQKNFNVKKFILTGAAGIKPKRTLKYHLSVLSYKFQKFLVKTPFYFQYKEDLFNNSGSLDYKNASEKMKKVLIKVVNEDLSFLFSEVTQETVLFWGDRDLAVPLSDAKVMEQKIKNSKLIVVKGSHYAFLENQEKFVKEIKKLIKK